MWLLPLGLAPCLFLSSLGVTGDPAIGPLLAPLVPACGWCPCDWLPARCSDPWMWLVTPRQPAATWRTYTPTTTPAAGAPGGTTAPGASPAATRPPATATARASRGCRPPRQLPRRCCRTWRSGSSGRRRRGLRLRRARRRGRPRRGCGASERTTPRESGARRWRGISSWTQRSSRRRSRWDGVSRFVTYASEGVLILCSQASTRDCPMCRDDEKQS